MVECERSPRGPGIRAHDVHLVTLLGEVVDSVGGHVA